MKAFFQEEAEGPSDTDDRAMPGFSFVLRGLFLLEALEEDRSAYVASSPVIRELPAAERAQVAASLDLTRSEAREAVSILEDVAQAGDGPEDDSDWERLALARMAAGSFDKALDYFRSRLGGPVTSFREGETGSARSSVRRVELAFNLAMAMWASRGAPDALAFADVVELLGDDDDTGLENHPNALQAIAVAKWFTGRAEGAREGLDLAEQACRIARDGAQHYSCWSYTRVSRDTFLDHCGEIRRLFDGDEVTPEFMRMAETSPAVEAPAGE